MKKIFFISIIGLLLFSCDKNEPKFCDVEDPIAELGWLNEIVTKANNDTTGNYQGSIYAEEYKNQHVIYVDMALGSGGVAGYWFNCNGSSLSIETDKPPTATKKNKLFSNINQ